MVRRGESRCRLTVTVGDAPELLGRPIPQDPTVCLTDEALSSCFPALAGVLAGVLDVSIGQIVDVPCI